MEPITVLLYITVSHYTCYIFTNFSDYLKFQSNFRNIQQEINNLQYQMENVKNDNQACMQKILRKIQEQSKTEIKLN